MSNSFKTEKKEMEKIAKQQYEENNKESIRKRKQNYYQLKKDIAHHTKF